MWICFDTALRRSFPSPLGQVQNCRLIGPKKRIWMLTIWIAWAGVVLVVLVLLKLLYMNLLLVWVLKKEPSLADGLAGKTPHRLPLLTVIVAAKDEESHLEECVRSILGKLLYGKNTYSIVLLSKMFHDF